MVRNIILCTAPSSGGKTTYLKALETILKLPKYGIVSDIHFIANSVEADHLLQHGTQHTHPEEVANMFGFTENEFNGHDHVTENGSIPVWPFMVTSNWITDRTLELFWNSLLKQPDNKLVLAELA